MDNNSVEMQTKENNPKKNGRIAVCCCIVAAICIVVATVLVMHFRNSDGAAIAGTDTTESESNSDQSQDNETEAKTEATKPEFEVSETGVLTAYNGDDETVVIPDNVISIGEDAFGTSLYADEIKTVKLGKSVEDIDVQAFVSLTKLENVEVPDENSNYTSGDGVLIKTDNSVFFCMPSIIRDDYDMFDVFFDVISDKIDGTGESKLVSGGMIAGIEIVYAEEEMKDFSNSIYDIYCNYFTANNQTKQFNELIVYKQTHRFPNSKITRVYNTNEGIIFTNRRDYGFGDTWIFAKDSIIHTEIIYPSPNYGKIGNEEWYNYSIIRFIKGEDGSLNYTRIPYKYVGVGGEYVCCGYWTGLDEFAYEEGYVKIENGKIIYNPVKTLTAKECGVDETYIRSLFNLESEDEVNEYLSRQAQKYEAAK